MEKKKRSKTPLKILEYLTLNSSSKWKLANELKKSYSNIHATVQMLLDSNFIKIAKKKASVKNPKMQVEYYDVTLNGLVYALKNPKLWSHIDRIAEYHKEKLLIFKCWQKLTLAEKETIKNFLLEGYEQEKYSAFGRLFNLDFLALFHSEDKLRSIIDDPFTQLVLFKDLRPIVDRVELLKRARLQRLKNEYSEFKEKLEPAYEKEIERLSSALH